MISLWPGYKGDTHEDSWEFLSFLLNSLHKGLLVRTIVLCVEKYISSY